MRTLERYRKMGFVKKRLHPKSSGLYIYIYIYIYNIIYIYRIIFYNVYLGL